MTNILLIQHYSLNKGDISILITIIESLKQHIADAKFSVSASNPEATTSLEQVEFLAQSFSIDPRRKAIVLRMSAILFEVLKQLLGISVWALFKKIWGREIRLLLSREIRDLLQAYSNADIVIACGGGYLNGQGWGIVLVLYNIFLAKFLGKPVMLFPQSIGPFLNNPANSLIYKPIARFVLNRVDLITLREPISKQVLEQLGVTKPPIYVTADTAFLLNVPGRAKARKILARENLLQEAERPFIGVTLLHPYWRYPGVKDSEVKHEEYKKALAQTLDYSIAHFDATAVFIPVNKKGLFGYERPLIDEIVKLMEHRHRVKIVNEEYTPEELKALIAKMDMLVGTRLHPNIWAASAGVPSVSIMYEPKAKGMMQMIGQDEFVIDINTITPEQLISSVNKLWDDKDEIKISLENKMGVLQKLASLNARFAMQLIEFSKNRKGKFSPKLSRDEIQLLQNFN